MPLKTSKSSLAPTKWVSSSGGKESPHVSKVRRQICVALCTRCTARGPSKTTSSVISCHKGRTRVGKAVLAFLVHPPRTRLVPLHQMPSHQPRHPCSVGEFNDGLQNMRHMAWKVGAAACAGFAFGLDAACAAPCPAGLVVREAAPADAICVTPASKRRAATDNATAPLRWVPGSFGPKTCSMGFVWRQAFASDLTCVTPQVRTETLQENKNPAGDL